MRHYDRDYADIWVFFTRYRCLFGLRLVGLSRRGDMILGGTR